MKNICPKNSIREIGPINSKIFCFYLSEEKDKHINKATNFTSQDMLSKYYLSDEWVGGCICGHKANIGSFPKNIKQKFKCNKT